MSSRRYVIVLSVAVVFGWAFLRGVTFLLDHVHIADDADWTRWGKALLLVMFNLGFVFLYGWSMHQRSKNSRRPRG